MKYFFSTICLSIVISFFSSCKKDSRETLPVFDYEQAAGIWVPYEVTEKGTIHSISASTTGIFGSYASSVQLNKDKTFIPIMWLGKDNFRFQTSQTGTFEYLSNNKLRFNNGYAIPEWEIIKFVGDDLWLKTYLRINLESELWEYVYKFKRQH